VFPLVSTDVTVEEKHLVDKIMNVKSIHFNNNMPTYSMTTPRVQVKGITLDRTELESSFNVIKNRSRTQLYTNKHYRTTHEPSTATTVVRRMIGSTLLLFEAIKEASKTVAKVPKMKHQICGCFSIPIRTYGYAAKLLKDVTPDGLAFTVLELTRGSTCCTKQTSPKIGHARQEQIWWSPDTRTLFEGQATYAQGAPQFRRGNKSTLTHELSNKQITHN
jgi:hypothetical protein